MREEVCRKSASPRAQVVEAVAVALARAAGAGGLRAFARAAHERAGAARGHGALALERGRTLALANAVKTPLYNIHPYLYTLIYTVYRHCRHYV